jgi:hypothetical protein
VCDYGVNDSAELLAKIKAFEESKDIWAITDIRVSSFFESFILGHLNDQHSLELNKLGFAPMNQLETRALRSASGVMLLLYEQVPSLFNWHISFIDEIFTLIKTHPSKRAVLVNALRCMCEHFLNDRIGNKISKSGDKLCCSCGCEIKHSKKYHSLIAPESSVVCKGCFGKTKDEWNAKRGDDWYFYSPSDESLYILFPWPKRNLLVKHR